MKARKVKARKVNGQSEGVKPRSKARRRALALSVGGRRRLGVFAGLVALNLRGRLLNIALDRIEALIGGLALGGEGLIV